MVQTITDVQLFEAVNHALAAVHEFDHIEGKLAVFGLEVEAVHRLLQERWRCYRDETEYSADAHFMFVRAFVEGLLTGMQLGRR
jgi:hypothetical protein